MTDKAARRFFFRGRLLQQAVEEQRKAQSELKEAS
jgi:hypothetical protein